MDESNYIPNHIITDKMGYEIVQALNGVTGALGGEVGGDSSILICHPVKQYPGEGSDPYEGNYVGDVQDPPTWLDVTLGEIKAALKSGQAVFMPVANKISDETSVDEREDLDLWNCICYLLMRVSYNSNDVDTKVLTFSSVIRPVNFSNTIFLFAVTDDDYPCALRMQDPNHPESDEPAV